MINNGVPYCFCVTFLKVKKKKKGSHYAALLGSSEPSASDFTVAGTTDAQSPVFTFLFI
jgi:hypothetical protein